MLTEHKHVLVLELHLALIIRIQLDAHRLIMQPVTRHARNVKQVMDSILRREHVRCVMLPEDNIGIVRKRHVDSVDRRMQTVQRARKILKHTKDRAVRSSVRSVMLAWD